MLNSRIPASKTVNKRGFDMYRVSLWQFLLLKVDNQQVAKKIGENTQVLTTNDGTITYLQLSDDLWDSHVFAWLVASSIRTPQLTQMPAVVEPRKFADFEKLLPPIAREYIHRQLADRPPSIDLISPLRMFDTRSVLSRNMREYILTVRSYGILDAVALEVIQRVDDSANPSELARQINAQFNSSHRPSLNLLYSEERLKLWLEQKHVLKNFDSQGCGKKAFCLSSAKMKQFILDPLTIPGQPARIMAEEICLEWQKYERTEAPGGKVSNGVNTGIIRKKFDPNFQLVSHDAIGMHEPLPNFSQDIQRAALEFLNRTKVTDITKETVNKSFVTLSSGNRFDYTQISKCTKALLSFVSIDEDIASELARINRLRIETSPKSVLEDAKNRRIQTTATPSQIVVFYKLMLEAIKTNPKVPPFGLRNGKDGKVMAVIHPSIWKEHFVKPRLVQLSTLSSTP